MFIYLAGSISPEQSERIANKAGANHFLFTFAHTGAQACAKYLCTQPQRRIFIDSGAFSVWKSGSSIKLGDYIEFCKDIQKIAKCPVRFFALDVIPGKWGEGTPTQAEIEKACEEGWDNYQTMKQEGIPCLMTFHQFDHVRWLTRIADDSDYFAISPRKAGVSTKEKFNWLEHVFRHIQPLETRNGSLRLKKKVHGLGLSSPAWMVRFPFYSVDNTVWLQGSRAHLRREASGRRTLWRSLEQWEKLARAQGIPTRFLREMLGYGVPGENPDPDGNSGSYWLLYLAMWCDVELERRITKHWRDEGLVLDEEPAKPSWEILKDELDKREKERPIAEVHAELEALAAKTGRWNAAVAKLITDPELAQWLGLKEK